MQSRLIGYSKWLIRKHSMVIQQLEVYPYLLDQFSGFNLWLSLAEKKFIRLFLIPNCYHKKSCDRYENYVDLVLNLNICCLRLL